MKSSVADYFRILLDYNRWANHAVGAIARELGVYRNTVRKYALADSPPLRKRKGTTRTAASDGEVYSNGHFR